MPKKQDKPFINKCTTLKKNIPITSKKLVKRGYVRGILKERLLKRLDGYLFYRGKFLDYFITPYWNKLRIWFWELLGYDCRDPLKDVIRVT